MVEKYKKMIPLCVYNVSVFKFNYSNTAFSTSKRNTTMK